MLSIAIWSSVIERKNLSLFKFSFSILFKNQYSKVEKYTKSMLSIALCIFLLLSIYASCWNFCYFIHYILVSAIAAIPLYRYRILYRTNNIWKYDDLKSINLKFTWFKTSHGSAPLSSRLLMYTSLGSWYVIICLSTEMDWLFTPPTLDRTRTAASRQRQRHAEHSQPQRWNHQLDQVCQLRSSAKTDNF